MVRVQRIDLRMLGSCQVVDIVSLDRLIKKRNPNQQDKGEEKRELQRAVASQQQGFHRSTGRRAAVTSSTRLIRVPCGAVLTSSGSDSTSSAIEIIASINWSSSSLLSVSVGSIIIAPRTISGKLTVYGWKP